MTTRTTPQRRTPADPKTRLGQLLKARRRYLHLTQEELRDARGPRTGPGLETVRKAENGRLPDQPHADTFRKFEVALLLNKGTCLAVWQGLATELDVLNGGGKAVQTAQVTGIDVHRPDFTVITRRRIAELITRSSKLVDLAETEGSDNVLMYARSVRDLVSDLTATMDALYGGCEVLQSLSEELDSFQRVLPHSDPV